MLYINLTDFQSNKFVEDLNVHKIFNLAMKYDDTICLSLQQIGLEIFIFENFTNLKFALISLPFELSSYFSQKLFCYTRNSV